MLGMEIKMEYCHLIGVCDITWKSLVIVLLRMRKNCSTSDTLHWELPLFNQTCYFPENDFRISFLVKTNRPLGNAGSWNCYFSVKWSTNQTWEFIFCKKMNFIFRKMFDRNKHRKWFSVKRKSFSVNCLYEPNTGNNFP